MKLNLCLVWMILLPFLIYGQRIETEDIPSFDGISQPYQEKIEMKYRDMPFMRNAMNQTKPLLPQALAKKTSPYELFQFDSLNVRYKGSWPFCTPFDVDGDSLRNLMFLYFWPGGIWTIDVSTPSNPVKINEDIRVRGDPSSHPLFYTSWDSLLYIANGSMGLEIWDTKNITAPYRLGQLSTQGKATSICVKGDYAYLGNGSSLRILDVSNPSNPSEIGSVSELPGYLWDLTVSGDYVYTAEGNGVSIIDVSVPSSPSLAGRFDNVSFGISYGIAVKGNYTYVGAYVDGTTGYLLVLDVADPSNPQLVDTLYFDDGPIYSVEIQGDYAYLTTSWDWAPVVDISDPANPVRVADINGSSWGFNIKTSGNLVFVSAQMSCWIADITDPTNPVTLTLIEPPDIATNITDVGIYGQYAYITSFESGLRILDITIPYCPVEVGYTGLSGTGLLSPAFAVSMNEQCACVAMVVGGLRIVDIANPLNPVEISSYNGHSVVTWNVKVQDTLAFLACDFWSEPGGLVILNISDPALPQEVSYLSIGQHTARDVDVFDNHAFLASTLGLHSIDISDPATPVEVDFLPAPYIQDNGIQISGNYAYIVGGDYSNPFLQIVDITNPDSLIEKSTIFLTDYDISGYGIAIEDTLAYVVTIGYGKLVVISIASPDSPYVIGYIELPDCQPYGVAAKNGLAYAAAWNGGVQIYEVFSPQGINEKVAAYRNLGISLTLSNNPVRGENVKISYSLNQSQNISLDLYNLMGQRIREIAVGYQDKGQHLAILNIMGLPADVYFLVLKTHQGSLCKKMVILK
ncbi:MAG: T9SS type A sorting domain-containing protein [bacterium]